MKKTLDLSSNASSLTTLLSHIARQYEGKTTTVNLPVQRGSTVLFESIAQAFATGDTVATGDTSVSTYGTVGLSTSLALMDAVAAIEGRGHSTRAALMPSGLAAISVALLAYLKAGDHLLVTDSVYGPTRLFCDGLLARMNVSVTYFAPEASPEEIAVLITPATRIIYLESPGSYTFELQDVPAICAMAKARGLLTMIDNAWGSPMFANAFDWGVDISVLPLTKYWSGHSDVLMGAVVVREPLWLSLWETVRQLGICVGGDDAYLVLRGLRTVSVRMAQQQQTTLKMAIWLEQHEMVASVAYPALPSHPQHAIWKRDFSGASGLFSFELKPSLFEGLSTSEKWQKMALLCDGRAHFGIGYSWGGYESLIMPARIDSMRSARKWTGGPLVRIQVGLESAEDLITDLGVGLAALGATNAA